MIDYVMRHVICTLSCDQERDMQGQISFRDIAVVIMPLIILWLLLPAIKSPEPTNAAKGLVIGIYLSLSTIGLINIHRRLKQNS